MACRTLECVAEYEARIKDAFVYSAEDIEALSAFKTSGAADRLWAWTQLNAQNPTLGNLALATVGVSYCAANPGSNCFMEGVWADFANEAVTAAVYAALGGVRAGGNPTQGVGREGSLAGSVEGANFAQTRIRSDGAFSAEGQKIYSDLAGYPVRTVGDLSSALKKGDIKPADVPVDFVDMNGARLILNTRTSSALQDAGIPQSQWYGTQRTGQIAYIDASGRPVT